MRHRYMGAVVVVLAMSALACTCNLLSGLTGSTSQSLFQDDFSNKNNGWDENTSDNASTGYGNGDYVMKVFQTSWFVWANPESAKSSLSNIHIAVTASNTGAATEPGFGVICDYVDRDNYYYMGVSVDGYYIIVKTMNGDDTPLSDQSSWITSDAVPVNASSYNLEADCGNGTLTLSVNGQQVDSVSDSTFSSGSVGLFARSFDEPNAEIHFDNFVVTALQ
jgi:hypothetical protein